jgi:hypothetical protein
LKGMGKVESYKDFVTEHFQFLHSLNLNTVLDVLYGDITDELIFVLHVDETQNLFSLDNQLLHWKVIFHIRDEIISCFYSKRTILPVLSGTNAALLHSLFKNSSCSQRNVSVELLHPKHFEAIIRDLYKGKELPDMEAFLDITELLAGHPRLFGFFLAFASTYYDSFYESQTVVEDIKGATFNVDGFITFLTDMNNRKDPYSDCWALLRYIQEAFLDEEIPEGNKFLQQLGNHKALRDAIVLAVLEGKPVTRSSMIHGHHTYGELEHKGLIYLDNSGLQSRGSLIPKCSLPILSYILGTKSILLTEPILDMTGTLSPDANEKQDLHTLFNRITHHRAKCNNQYTVDLHTIWPEWFQTKSEYIVKVPKRFQTTKLMEKMQSMKDMRKAFKKYTYMNGFINGDKASWADSVARLEIDEISFVAQQQRKKYLYILIQSKRHETETNTVERFSNEAYFEKLKNAVTELKGTSDVLQYVFVCDTHRVEDTDPYVNPYSTRNNKTAEEPPLDWVKTYQKDTRSQFDGVFRSKLRELRNRIDAKSDTRKLFHGTKVMIDISDKNLHDEIENNIVEHGARILKTVCRST